MFFLSSSLHHRDLHSFPTRRSSDLSASTEFRIREVHPCPSASTNLCTSCPSTTAARSKVGRSRRARSEEHTSELQSPDHLVCRLLLEKKKKILHTAKLTYT